MDTQRRHHPHPASYSIVICIAMLFVSTCFVAQTPLLPNGDFEQIDSLPDKWIKSSSCFNGALKSWSSPTQGSPDIYHPEVEVPQFWRSQGFGRIRPIRGRTFVGITVYGCEGGKPHCREYLQTELSEPLVPGQQYALSIHASPLPRGLRIANLGVAASYAPVEDMTDEMLDLQPLATVSNIIDTRPGQWAIIKLLFQAKARERYLLIGNFSSDRMTNTRRDPVFTKHGFAYYYIDEALLTKIPPIITYADTTNTFIGRSYEIDEPVVLEHVYFDHDESTFRPESYQTLAHLLELLMKYPSMRIHLAGHTDADGSHRYNRRLARRRAKAVYDYLIDQGVDEARLSSSGHGETAPIADNNSDIGKAKNRRVEFSVQAW